MERHRGPERPPLLEQHHPTAPPVRDDDPAGGVVARAEVERWRMLGAVIVHTIRSPPGDRESLSQPPLA